MNVTGNGQGSPRAHRQDARNAISLHDHSYNIPTKMHTPDLIKKKHRPKPSCEAISKLSAP